MSMSISPAGEPYWGPGMNSPDTTFTPPTYKKAEFMPWPKVARLNREIVVTEKIDGTNAAIHVLDGSTCVAQSRTRLITPEKDNFGFATWVKTHETILAETLGLGVHFGEWWGSGIQRGYGLVNNDKRFSLFNTAKWDVDFSILYGAVRAVPVLYQGVFSETAIRHCVDLLRTHGSYAAPGYMNPEGIVVFHTAAKQMFKVTLLKDESPKGMNQ